MRKSVSRSMTCCLSNSCRRVCPISKQAGLYEEGTMDSTDATDCYGLSVLIRGVRKIRDSFCLLSFPRYPGVQGRKLFVLLLMSSFRALQRFLFSDRFSAWFNARFSAWFNARFSAFVLTASAPSFMFMLPVFVLFLVARLVLIMMIMIMMIMIIMIMIIMTT